VYTTVIQICYARVALLRFVDRRKGGNPAGKIAKNVCKRSAFLSNQHSKYDAVLSKVHSSRVYFSNFAGWETTLHKKVL